MKLSFGLIFCLCCVAPSFANDSAQALQEAFLNALKANDVEGLASCYAPQAVNFPLDSMVGIGPESVRTSWAGFFSSYRVIDARLSDDHMEETEDLAVAWGLFTIIAEPIEGGDAVEMKGRYMDVAKPIDGKWLYVADHASLPQTASKE